MKRLLILPFLIVLFVTGLVQAQVGKTVEVGIEEQLGSTIPLDAVFFNEFGDTITIGSLIDKPTVFSFVYFDCPGLCSPLQDGVADVVEHMDMELGKDYQVITISFNTKDTPEKAQIKKQNFVQKIGKEKEKYWIYLTGDQANIDKVTNAFGFRYKVQGLDFAHASAIMVVSPQGKITRYLYGLSFLPFDLKMAVIEAQKGISRPTINKILEVCFAYDPVGRTYTLQITRIVGGLIIFIALLIFITLMLKGRRKDTTKK